LLKARKRKLPDIEDTAIVTETEAETTTLIAPHITREKWLEWELDWLKKRSDDYNAKNPGPESDKHSVKVNWEQVKWSTVGKLVEKDLKGGRNLDQILRKACSEKLKCMLPSHRIDVADSVDPSSARNRPANDRNKRAKQKAAKATQASAE
jgi:hypothetical protein